MAMILLKIAFICILGSSSQANAILGKNEILHMLFWDIPACRFMFHLVPHLPDNPPVDTPTFTASVIQPAPPALAPHWPF
jgi:hypothetical protein